MEMVDIGQELPIIGEIWPFHQTTLESDAVALICEFLTLKDLLTLRKVSVTCNRAVNDHPRLALKSQGIIRRKWHQESIGIDPETTIQWKHLVLHRFAFHRNSKLFRTYWMNSAQNVTHLTIKDSSMECYGYADILNNLPVLNTLILTGVKLRDIDNHHLIEEDQPNKCVGPFHEPLRHLTIENTCRIEGCFFEYLRSRADQLETLTVKTCFEAVQNTPTETFIKDRSTRRIFEFQFYINELLILNANTLTKFTCENNHIVSSRIFEVYKKFPSPALKDLRISFSDDTVKNFLRESAPEVKSNLSDMLEFFKIKGGQLETLRIIFEGQVSNEILEKLLDPCKDNLLSLRLTFGSASNLRQEDIDLPILKKISKLSKLEIFDRKELGRKDVLGFLNTKTAAEAKEELFKKIKSSIKTDGILPLLPAEVKELTLSRLIVPLDMFADLSPELQVNFIASFGKLTRLEIRGPWLPTIKPTLDMIVNEAKQLRTLILSSCFITDSHLTGLSEAEIRDFRLCNSYLTKLPKNATDAGNFDKFRFCFSLLPELKNLDLSGNSGISDMSLLQPLRVPGLQSLNLSSCNISDKGLDLISKSMPLLRSLNLRCCCRVSKFALNQVIKSCPKLSQIYCSSKHNRPGAHTGLFKTVWNPNFQDVVSYKMPKLENGTENEDKAEMEAEAESVDDNADN